jgi:signal transduction histidine kinase
MPVLGIIAISFLTLSLAAGLTIALLPLGIFRYQGWFSGSSQVSLWLLLVLCGVFGLVLFALRSEAHFRSLLTAAGRALLVAGVLLGVEIFLIQARPPVTPVLPVPPVTLVTLLTPFIPVTAVALVKPVASTTISLWGLFILCPVLGVIALYAVEKAKRMEREAQEERELEMERQAQAACAEERMRTSLRFGRRRIRR